jgi:hypothetical protein
MCQPPEFRVFFFFFHDTFSTVGQALTPRMKSGEVRIIPALQEKRLRLGEVKWLFEAT